MFCMYNTLFRTAHQPAAVQVDAKHARSVPSDQLSQSGKRKKKKIKEPVHSSLRPRAWVAKGSAPRCPLTGPCYIKRVGLKLQTRSPALR